MQSLIKRNDFSPEDRKILNKIDRHIKELEEKVEQGGGSGESGETDNGGAEVYDINIELDEQYENFFLGKETTFNKDYEPLPFMMMGEGSFPPNSFVNVLINGKKFYSGVAQQTYIEGMEAAAVVPFDSSKVMSGMSSYEIVPSLVPVSIEGYGMLILTFLPHESIACIQGLTVVSQDEYNLKKVYDNAQAQSSVTLNHKISIIGDSYSIIRTTFQYLSDYDNIKEFFNRPLQLSILVDSTGTITEVVSKDPIYNSLLDRIKALENGN